jgi:hypothetical protein
MESVKVIGVELEYEVVGCGDHAADAAALVDLRSSA